MKLIAILRINKINLSICLTPYRLRHQPCFSAFGQHIGRHNLHHHKEGGQQGQQAMFHLIMGGLHSEVPPLRK